jgi:F0F1-type ATP synthase membrane subunit b/b'
MENQTLLWVIAGFVALAGLSMFFQMVAMVGLYRQVKAMQEKVLPLIPRAESLLEQARATVESSHAEIKQISAKTNLILDSTKDQLSRVEAVVTDASARAKIQLEKAEFVLDDTMTRVHETVAVLQGGVLKPLKEINGLVTGVRAGFGTLFQGSKRPSVVTATQDEEMFI